MINDTLRKKILCAKISSPAKQTTVIKTVQLPLLCEILHGSLQKILRIHKVSSILKFLIH